MVQLFLAWFRRFFAPDEGRLRVQLYLHQGLDLGAVIAYWSVVTGIPQEQFGKPYRAAADPTIRNSRHVFGCPSVRHHDATVS